MIKPEDTRAPDHGNLDIIAEVLPAAKKARDADDSLDGGRLAQRHSRYREAAGSGPLRPATQRLCMNNPYHRNFLHGLVEDYTRSYDIDGIMWGSERHGALGNALGAAMAAGAAIPAVSGASANSARRKRDSKAIVQFERVKQGYRQLEQFVRDDARRASVRWTATTSPSGASSCAIPEILAWEQFWHDSLRETYAAMYGKAQSIKPDVLVGWHIWHNNSFSPFYRAQQDLRGCWRSAPTS